MTGPEREAGITYAEVGISLDRCQPNGRGDCKTQCPRCHHTHSHANRHAKDLSVNVQKGEWKCHRCNWQSGLGVQAREQGKGAAMVSTPTTTQKTPLRGQNEPSRAIPVPVKRTYPTTLHPWAIALLKERGISESVAAEFSLGSTERTIDGELQRILHFPYFLDGRIVNVKHRILPKDFRQEGGAFKALYNYDNAEGSSTIVICEGELDVIACHLAGWAAVSAPDGAPGEIYDHSTEPATPTGKVAEVGSKGAAFLTPQATALFDGADRIIIATDDDLEGRALGDYLVEHFGPLKCWRVHWSAYGVKDANELLVKHGARKLDEALSRAKPVPLPGVRQLSTHKDALRHIYEHGYAPGVTSGWPEFDHYFRPELGKVVVVSGYPGHGKTSWFNNFFVNLARLNAWNIGLYSPEMGEEGEMLGKFVQIVADAPWLPTAENRLQWEAVEIAIDWVGDRFWEIYCDGTDSDGFSSLTVPQILERAAPLVLKHGLKALIIDPWNRCESSRPKGMTVEEYIGISLATISQWAKRMQVTVFIVIHPRKPDSIKGAEMTAPEAYEAAGAAHWYNMADVFLSIHRDKSHGDGLTTVSVKKHRKEGITGNIGDCKFKFRKATGRFIFHEATFPELGSQPYIELPHNLYVSPPQMENAEIAWEEAPL